MNKHCSVRKEKFSFLKHQEHHLSMLKDLRTKFWISLILTIPILFLSPMIQSMVGMTIHFYGQDIIILILSTIIFLYGGMPFLRGMKDELMSYRPGMMTLIGLAIILAYFYSAAIIFGFQGEPFFVELATLIDIMLVGHWLEMRSVIGASKSLERLALLVPSTAHKKFPDGTIRDIEIEKLKVGDVVIVRPGEKISADGVIVEGESEVNEAALTGESRPVYKSPGASVVAGALNGSGALTIEVNKSQSQTYLARTIELVSRVMESKSHAQNLADRAAFFLTLIAGTAGFITFVVWFFYSGLLSLAVTRSVTVMISACPHALGLAIPLVVTIVTTLSSKNGILIRNRTAFEQARKINAVVFDKTGTLTKGHFEVTDIIPVGNWQVDKILSYSAAIESYAKHSLADAIVKKAQTDKIKLPEVTSSKVFPGKGASATINNEVIFIGNKRLLNIIDFEENQLKKQLESVEKISQKNADEGKTVVFVATQNGIEGIIGLSDVLRPESVDTCKILKDMGIEVVMISGDNKSTSQAVAKKLGITKYYAEVLPDQKVSKIQGLQQEGFTVAMVGDGINDAPAIAVADVGIAIGAGTDVSIETADIILIKNDTKNVVDVIKLSKIGYRKMLQNIFWATGYNVFVIPLAAGVFVRYGIEISPAVGALIMSLSAIIVALNARLISYKGVE
ncbi:heavy metal translocating P-type ATPase [Candidatus Babeliales bacterium]|nr:heavy metal translocating P-type ATPase [Candidatus Babeliales bacterium]